jgi:hypothetical protein
LLDPAKKAAGLAWNYLLVVQGRAGANDAYWKADVGFIQSSGKRFWRVGAGDLNPGQAMSIKLPSPEKACVTLND